MLYAANKYSFSGMLYLVTKAGNRMCSCATKNVTYIWHRRMGSEDKCRRVGNIAVVYNDSVIEDIANDDDDDDERNLHNVNHYYNILV
jgi:hypothetical protein